MLTSSEQVESISLRIGRFAIRFIRAAYHRTEVYGSASLPCARSGDEREQEVRTRLPRAAVNDPHGLPSEGGSA